ncbi:beta-1,3-galactosyltransferase 4-like [Varroa destructor]|uniref:Hexosyltransferase n=1 Tax=Varroa destructor TaxID=109461 RepID=A0A7M7K011_VARDE|nr:beta-1,3-galactosyltransferase 4-like [Varroa destructor]
MRCRFRRRFLSVLGGGILLIFAIVIMGFDGRQRARKRSWNIEMPVLLQTAKFPTDGSILVCVPSAPGNFDKRQAIRDTWATTRTIRVVFFVGVPNGTRAKYHQRVIEAEHESFDDIVQVGFSDTYRNLTLKVISLMLWASEHRWPDRRLIVKADDDTFVNTPLLLSYLDHFTNGNIYGLYQDTYTVPRCNVSACKKWGLTYHEFPSNIFPPHVRGAMYILTEMALERLLKYLFDPPFLYIEDIYITGLVAGRAGVPVCSLPSGLKIVATSPTKSTVFILNKGLLSQHYCQPQHHRDFWKRVRKNLPYKN